MTKNPRYTQSSNRTIIVIGLAVLTLVLGAVAWVSTSNLTSISSPVASSQLLTPVEYMDQFATSNTHALIDVRTPEEFASGHIQNAINIPLESLQDRLDEVPDDMPIIVYCRSGNRSVTAAQILVAAGVQPVYDLGGIQAWVTEGFPIQ